MVKPIPIKTKMNERRAFRQKYQKPCPMCKSAHKIKLLPGETCRKCDYTRPSDNHEYHRE